MISTRLPIAVSRPHWLSSAKSTSSDVPGQPFTGGTVIKFVENWNAVRDKLVPVVFEFPLR